MSQPLIEISQAKTAPDFNATDSEGHAINLSDFKGKNVFLVFNRGFV